MYLPDSCRPSFTSLTIDLTCLVRRFLDIVHVSSEGCYNIVHMSTERLSYDFVNMSSRRMCYDFAHMS